MFNYQQGCSYEKIKMLDGIKEIYIYYTGTEYIGDTISLERIDRNKQETGSSIVFHNDTKNEHIYESNLNESSTIVRGQTIKDNNIIYFYVVIDWSYFPDNTSTYFNIPLDIEKVISEKWSPIITHQIRIDGLESDVDIYNKEGFHIFKNYGYVMKSNGGIARGNDWQYTDFIKANEGDVFNVAIPSSANQFYWKIAYYDENKNFVSGTDNVGTITIPNGIVYFRCCGATSDTKSVRHAYNNTILYNLINSNTIKIGAIEEHIQSILLDKNNLSITKNKYVANNSIGNLTGCCYTDYIPVEPGQVWVIENCYLFVYLCEFYNANKDYVSTKVITEGSYEIYNVTIPNGCYFMRVNIGMQEFDSRQTCFYIQGLKEYVKLVDVILPAIDIIGIQSVIKSVIDSDNSVQKQNNHYHSIKRLSSLQNAGGNLIAFGDSITYGYTSTSSYDAGNVGKTQGQPSCANPYIKIIADGLGKILKNMAVSGACATQVSGKGYMYNQILSVRSLSADIIIVAIGINDYNVNNDNLGTLLDVIGSSPSTTSFYGEINKAFAKIHELWPDADVVIVTPIPYLGEAKINSLSKFVDALIEIAVIYNFSVVCGEKLEFPKEKGIFANLTLADNLHPTALGHKLMGNGILNLVKQQ